MLTTISRAYLIVGSSHTQGDKNELQQEKPEIVGQFFSRRYWSKYKAPFLNGLPNMESEYLKVKDPVNEGSCFREYKSE